MPPCQQIVEEGISGKNIVFWRLVSLFAHEGFHRIYSALRGLRGAITAAAPAAVCRPQRAMRRPADHAHRHG
jgi:hypothetical protein